MYAYSQNGRLINRIAFGDMIKRYGEIADLSPSGQVLVFKKSLTMLKDISDEKEFVNSFMTVNIGFLDIFQIKKVKTFNILNLYKTLKKR